MNRLSSRKVTFLCACLCLVGCLDRNSQTKMISVKVGARNSQVQTEAVVSGEVSWQREIHEVALPVPHIEVEDSFRNDTATIQGVKLNHFIPDSSLETWLGGQKFLALKDLNIKKSPVDFSDPWNPTVFSKFGSGGVGLVAQDDVFRQQVRVYYDPLRQRSGLKSEMLCLGPKSSYKVVWAIYTTNADYWDFINSVREVWGVNHNIDGSYIWFLPDDILAMDFNFLKEHLKFQGVKIANMYGGWVDPRQEKSKDEKADIGFGAAVISPVFQNLRARIKLATEKLKLAAPAIKVLIYFDAQRDSTRNAKEIYQDSLFKTSEMKPESTNWDNLYKQTWSVYPTLENSFGRKLNDVVSKMRELGDGLYWDEMDALDYSGVRFTTDTWDGHSCLLDAKAKVRSKIGFTNLLSEMAKESYAEKGELIFGNMPPTTWYFTKRPDYRMVEGQHLRDYSSYAHLTTPLAYIGSEDNWESIISPIDRGLLPAGVRLDYTTPLFDKLYPINVLKIYPGVIFGTDKILISRNGTYGWASDCENLKIWQFDRKGQLSPSSVKLVQGKSCVVKTDLPNKNIIILERDAKSVQQSKKIPAFFYQVDR